jgi:hypothetical protein
MSSRSTFSTTLIASNGSIPQLCHKTRYSDRRARSGAIAVNCRGSFRPFPTRSVVAGTTLVHHPRRSPTRQLQPESLLGGRATRVPHRTDNSGTERTTTVTVTTPASWPCPLYQLERIPRMCLIRMRSQVQVLAGPPPIVAGQSVGGSQPGAFDVGLGRAGAARPSSPAPPVAPPEPPTRASGSATTTHRGRAPSRGWQPRGGCRHLALQPAPVPTVQPPATGAPHAGLACLVAQRQARPPRPAPNSAARVATDLPLTNATSAASPASRPPRPSSSRRRPGSHRGLHPSRWSGSPGHLDLVPTATA